MKHSTKITLCIVCLVLCIAFIVWVLSRSPSDGDAPTNSLSDQPLSTEPEMKEHSLPERSQPLSELPTKGESAPETVRGLIELTEFTLTAMRRQQQEKPPDPEKIKQVAQIEAILTKLKEFPSDQTVTPEFIQEHIAPVLWPKQ
jgi:hypothetical protein